MSQLYARAWEDLEVNQRAFLVAFARGRGHVTRAAAAAGIDRRTHTRWLQDSERYQEAFTEAQAIAGEVAELEADRRAFQGLLRYKFDKNGNSLRHPVTGEPYYELEYSDTVLMFLLRGALPEKYKDRHEHTGKNGGPIETEAKVVFYLPANGRDAAVATAEPSSPAIVDGAGDQKREPSA